MFKKFLNTIFKKVDHNQTHPPVLSLREEQYEIVHFLQNSTSNVLGIEAPTGIGKTVAYLYYASKWPGKVVISTFTKTLQHQLEYEIKKFFPEMSYVVLKGKNNYICKDKTLLLNEHERNLLLSTKPPLEIMEQVKITPQYCRPQYECQFRDSCEYMRLIEQTKVAKLLIINHFMLNTVNRFTDVLLIVDEAHKLQEALKRTLDIPEEALKLPKEPKPEDYNSVREYNRAIERFLTLKELNQIASKHGINQPGRYELVHNTDLSASRIIYTSATFPYDIHVDDMLTVKDRRSWSHVDIQVENTNYKQSNYNSILLKTIRNAMKTYERVLVLSTSYEQVRLVKQNIPEIVAEYEMNIYQLRDKMLSGEIKAVIGCNKLWQGFDLPGRKCIIMTKLPFPNLDDCPDYQVSINKMLFEFKQGLGRMVRTPECSGTIIILDNRVSKYPDVIEILKEKEKLGAKVTLAQHQPKVIPIDQKVAKIQYL